MNQMKTCSKCDKPQPATTEYFSRDNRNLDGLRYACKSCQREYNKRRCAEDPEKYQAQKQEQNKRYQKSNPEKVKQLRERWKKENPEKVKASHRRYAKKHPEKIAEILRRRRSKKANVPCFFTSEDETHALSYFNGRCAICDRPLRDLFGNHYPALDHWIPVSSPDCPGTIPTNMIPLCHGVDGCNNKKSNRDPIEWIEKQYSKQAARKILDRIRGYFESLATN
jgi:hypothetical protein